MVSGSEELMLTALLSFKPGYRTGQHGVQNRQAVSVPGNLRFPRISVKYEVRNGRRPSTNIKIEKGAVSTPKLNKN